MLVPNYYFLLFKAFLNSFRSGQHLPKFPTKTLVLIDFYDHERGGHFGHWLAWFAVEFSRRFKSVLVLTPCPKKTYRMVRKRGCYLQNQVFLRLPETFLKGLDLTSVLKNTITTSSDLHIFIMWGYDLLHNESILPINYPWSTLIGVSRVYRCYKTEHAVMENKLLGLLNRDDNCRAFFQPDNYLKGCHEKEVWITDFEDIKISKRKTSLVKSINKFCNSSFSIGVFGMLHGERCVNEILLLARAQPQIRFVLAGKIFLGGIQKDLIDDLKPGMRANLLIINSFITNETELNSTINSVDALLIDGANYPVQSGIVCRAMHFGKWILSPEGTSWTNDVIAKEGVGHSYKNRDEDLENLWKKWKAGGGESRSNKYSRMLRDSTTITNCFDELTRRLIR